eukprot:evm.model.scf_89.3 EVM.evm.TU.scf_89.3   scf_89:6364-8197(-)
MRIRLWHAVAGAAVYAGAAYGALVLCSTKATQDEGISLEGDGCLGSSVGGVFDRLASQYDGNIAWDEAVMGISLMRWWLMKDIKGDVLEISSGTGRNLPYYTISQLRSLTLLDTSQNMLDLAKKKYKEIAWNTDGAYKVKTQFVCASAASLFSNTGAPRSHAENIPERFDVVVDTFGLCSHEDPVAELRAVANVLRPGGKLILLEHGRGHYAWINNMLDESAREHFRKYANMLGMLRCPVTLNRFWLDQ